MPQKPENRPREWGQIVRDLREEAGMSQRALARIGGVYRATLIRLENGQGGYEIDIIERCLSVFGYVLRPVPIPQDSPPPEERSRQAAQRLLAIT